jgi:hypothetical protein
MVTGYSLNNQPNYAALWQKTSIPASEFRNGMTAAQYQTTFDEVQKKGYRLVYVQGFSVGNTAYFNATWQKTAGPAQIARHNLTAQQYQDNFNQLTGQGYKLTCVTGYTKPQAPCGMPAMPFH